LQSINSICSLVLENWKNSGLDSQTQWHYIQMLVYVVIFKSNNNNNNHNNQNNLISNSNEQSNQLMKLANQLFKQYLSSTSIFDSYYSSKNLLDWFFSFDSIHSELLSTMFSDLLLKNLVQVCEEQFIRFFISKFISQSTWSTVSTFDSIKSTFSSQFFQLNSGISDCSFGFLSLISISFRANQSLQRELISIFLVENGILLLKLMSLIQTNNTDLQRKVLSLAIDIFDVLLSMKIQIAPEILKQLELYLDCLCGLITDSNSEIKNVANNCLSKISQMNEKIPFRIAYILTEKLLQCTNEEKSKGNIIFVCGFLI